MRGEMRWVVTLDILLRDSPLEPPVYKTYEVPYVKIHESGVLETWWENSEGWRSDVKFHVLGTWRSCEEKRQ